MGKALRYVPPGKGKPAPDPVGVRDSGVLEGPHADEVIELLDETTQIAEVDWQYRHLIPQRNRLWARLYQLGVSQRRMVRAYAVNGRPLTTHVGVTKVLGALGVLRPKNTPKPQEEEDE